MQINREAADKHTIQSYTDTQITVNNIQYSNSLIISRETIVPNWNVQSLFDLNDTDLLPLLALRPEIIIIGHNQKSVQVPMVILQALAKQRIGIECMSIGAASRTFNVLLGEQRAVVSGILFSNSIIT